MCFESPLDRYQMLCVKEVAVMLGVSEKTVYREIKAGKLEIVRVAGSIRITREEVDRYIRDNTSSRGRGRGDQQRR